MWKANGQTLTHDISSHGLWPGELIRKLWIQKSTNITNTNNKNWTLKESTVFGHTEDQGSNEYTSINSHEECNWKILCKTKNMTHLWTVHNLTTHKFEIDQ